MRQNAGLGRVVGFLEEVSSDLGLEGQVNFTMHKRKEEYFLRPEKWQGQWHRKSREQVSFTA